MSAGRIVFMGDSCLSLTFGEGGEGRIDHATNVRCVSIAAALERLARRGIRDIVPTFDAVAVHYDAAQVGRDDLAEALLGLSTVDQVPGAEGDIFEIPTEYGGRGGPDLAAIAEFGGCSEEDVVRLHSGRVYRVYMLGFLPGFAYMGQVDGRIAMPRLDTPRARVVAGSVGIAATQTGIYPCDTPGGWRILGRTATKVFDPARAKPFLLRAGDQVKFVPA